MKPSGFVWECECGQIEYGEYPPEECNGCQGVESFSKIPEDMIEDKVKENVLSAKPDDEPGEEEQ